MSDFQYKYGTQWCFRDVTDFSPTAANDLRIGSPTLVQLDLTSLATANARQSTQADFTAAWGKLCEVKAAFELAATPTAGAVIELWLAPSSSSTAGTGNPGGVSGSDSAYTGYSSNMATSILQLLHIGDFVCTVQATGTVQIAYCGRFILPDQYGTLVVRNESGAAFHSDAAESHVVITELIPFSA